MGTVLHPGLVTGEMRQREQLGIRERAQRLVGSKRSQDTLVERSGKTFLPLRLEIVFDLRGNSGRRGLAVDESPGREFFYDLLRISGFEDSKDLKLHSWSAPY